MRGPPLRPEPSRQSEDEPDPDLALNGSWRSTHGFGSSALSLHPSLIRDRLAQNVAERRDRVLCGCSSVAMNASTARTYRSLFSLMRRFWVCAIDVRIVHQNRARGLHRQYDLVVGLHPHAGRTILVVRGRYGARQIRPAGSERSGWVRELMNPGEPCRARMKRITADERLAKRSMKPASAL